MASAQVPEDVGAVRVPLAEGIDVDVADWEKATAAVLRKSRKLADDAPDHDVWGLLTQETLDGLSITPLGTPSLVADLDDPGLPGEAPFTRGTTATRELEGWDVRGWFTDPDVDVTAQHVVTDLENGVNSLWITVGDGAVPADALARILEPVFLDLAPVVLDALDDPLAAARALDAVIEDKAVQPHPDTSYGADPTTPDGLAVVELARARGVRGVVVDATTVHDAGASEVQELAYSLATGARYLRALVEAGLSVEDAAAQIDVRYAATDEQLTTIAKLRAARLLWSRMLELSDVPAEQRGQRQHAVTSRPMMSAYDPYVNMLRTTIAAFSAGVGGAEAVTVLPFDEPLGLPEAFSRRIARNQSSLLIHESHLGKVVDIAGGSYAVEKLTAELAQAAWTLFGDLEEDPDSLQARIEERVAAREQQIAVRQRPITGLTEFPNLQETRPERRPYGRAPVVHRYGASFEALRDDPAKAPVFLATLGRVAQHTARATFAANLFAAGGIETVVAGATEGVDDVVSAYRDAGTPAVACLAGPDALYAEWGEDVVGALREAGAKHVIVAGKNDVGADDSAAMGVDALDFLRRTRQELAS
ncbi:methylmalonyl-CoA mutase family protein [Aeromicrobium terrae]|uniref:Methylmalonyl-CoA mutase n=1 Tax=Aeromicrobium terrae TaxID=2498846 RepID=A0A5C8NN25_9ACTN|nr:methylmalonyl-CoA mutase family protein [Aeromicrobium terrae]TXL62191.1 methylmalonyl-CoA mutase [Aeromicrobium terrae]